MKIWTRKAWDRYISNGQKRHTAFIANRWADNPDCLRAAVAAQLGVGEKHVIEGSMLLPAMSRAIRAFAQAVEVEEQRK